MPNSPITFKHLMIWCPFFARVEVNHIRVYSRILVKVCAVAMVMGLVKNKAEKNGFSLFKKNPVVRFSSSLAHYKLT